MIEYIGAGLMAIKSSTEAYKALSGFLITRSENINEEKSKALTKISGYISNESLKNEVEMKSLSITDQQLQDLLDTNYSYSFNRNQSYDTYYLKTLLQKSSPEERALLILGFARDPNNHIHGFCTILLEKIATKEILQDNSKKNSDNPTSIKIKDTEPANIKITEQKYAPAMAKFAMKTGNNPYTIEHNNLTPAPRLSLNASR